MLVRKVSKNGSREAFTLVEMLVVVAIIVVLAGVAVPITMSVLEKAKEDTARSVIKATLVPAVRRYMMDSSNKGNEPPTSLQELIGIPSVGLMADQLSDPWGKPYQYQLGGQGQSGDAFVITTVAPSGKVISSLDP